MYSKKERVRVGGILFIPDPRQPHMLVHVF